MADLSRLCVRCDNRHGCRSDPPICLTIERTPDERRLRGRALMEKRGRLADCAGCAHFRACWGAAAFRKARPCAEEGRDSP